MVLAPPLHPQIQPRVHGTDRTLLAGDQAPDVVEAPFPRGRARLSAFDAPQSALPMRAAAPRGTSPEVNSICRDGKEVIAANDCRPTGLQFAVESCGGITGNALTPTTECDAECPPQRSTIFAAATTTAN